MINTPFTATKRRQAAWPLAIAIKGITNPNPAIAKVGTAVPIARRK
jgi:hypothetical protein